MNLFFILSYIDDGKNPLLYTKDCLLKTLRKNEEIKGKIVTFKTFRELLLEELNKNFPEEYDAYMKNRQPDTTSVSNNMQPDTDAVSTKKNDASNN